MTTATPQQPPQPQPSEKKAGEFSWIVRFPWTSAGQPSTAEIEVFRPTADSNSIIAQEVIAAAMLSCGMDNVLLPFQRIQATLIDPSGNAFLSVITRSVKVEFSGSFDPKPVE